MPANEEPIGTVLRYDSKVHAALVHLDHGELATGDVIHIRGRRIECEEDVRSIRLKEGEARRAHEGDDVGIVVDYPVESGDSVFRVTDPYDVGAGSALDAVFR